MSYLNHLVTHEHEKHRCLSDRVDILLQNIDIFPGNFLPFEIKIKKEGKRLLLFEKESYFLS